MKASPKSFAVSAARRDAFGILLAVERGEGFADDLLRGGRVSALSIADRHLATTLVMGTLRWQIELDRRNRVLLAKPNARLDLEILIALRLGAFQILHLDRVPDHAAIGESVALAKLAGQKFASGMVNAVLRKLALEPKRVEKTAANARELADAFAHPVWLVDRWVAHYGIERARAICENGQRQPELTVRVDDLAAETELIREGVELAPGAMLTAARRVLGGDVAGTRAFKRGTVRIQEESSQLIAELGGVGRAELILDCCAAPGGKTLVLAQRKPQATVIAMDVSRMRLQAMRARVAASEYADQIELVEADVTQLAGEAEYDLVLADVPCSGTGTLGRNPEIRHRLEANDLERHHRRQSAILRAALRASKHRVIYSTCSLEPEENSDVVAEVAHVEGWRVIPMADMLDQLRGKGRLVESFVVRQNKAVDGSLTILPGSLGEGIQTDGFFMAVLEKLV